MHIYGASCQSSIRTLHATSQIVSRAIERGFMGRQECFSVVQQRLNSSTNLANDTSFFWQDHFGHIWSDYNNPIILESVCKEICGSGMGLYPDTANRLLTWFVPGLFLISSINFAPIGFKRFVMISHLFGDPIHSLWSLLSKLEDWNNYYDMARNHYRNVAAESWNDDDPRRSPRRVWWTTSIDKRAIDIAVILIAIRELLPSQTHDINVNSIYVCSCFEHKQKNFHKETAGNVVDKRMYGTLHTWFAIFTYIFGIVCAFVLILGGSPSPSGGKIAPAMLLSWLLPFILLSNIIGQFRAEDCIRIVQQFEDDVKARKGRHEEHYVQSRDPLPQEWTAGPADRPWETFLDSQAWSGGIYSSEVQKPMLESGARRFRSWFLIAVAATSVIISFGIGFGVLYSAPTFFSCRSAMVVIIMFVWLMSPIVTRIIMTCRLFGIDMRARWKALFWKDFAIGFCVLFILVASSCGLGNSCRCWAGFRNKVGGVVLNPKKQFTENNRYIYPILIAVCLFLQYLVLKTALYMGRTGLSVLTWSEKERRASLPSRAALSAGSGSETDGAAALVPHTGSGEQLLLGESGGYELIEYSLWDYRLQGP
ncbi:uncharacterized protein PAC_04845 [Phialocephala subalpina]|uniref:Uncharacterized protein n=1 Tax=Phialocephala subalpina TaxID=576137 RepID=A0A1L7WQA3_9HELO|nr:uncharacterized protein PAC_04845 [Phialocephala subalpina]